MIRVLIAEDHHLVRQGIQALLEKTGKVQIVAEASDGMEAVELVKANQPDVIIMDIAMPRMTGIQALEHLKTENCKIPVIILSMYSDPVLIHQALRNGAKGYLLKNALKEELMLAVNAALKGETYLSPAVSNILIEGLISKQEEILSPLDVLTQREKEILKLIAEGHTNRSISNTLQISVKTVEKHRDNILKKMNATDTATLVRLAIQYHLVFFDPPN
jgi:DNA-binding NarL/FixJ family response regulator